MGLIPVLILVGLALAIVITAVKIVPQGMEFTLEAFGRYTRTLQPGLHIIVPIYHRIGHKVNIRERVLDVPSQEVITRDNAMVTADAVVFVQVMDPSRASYQVNNLDLAIVNLAQTNVRTVVGAMELDEVLANRDQINTRLLATIDAATDPWGVKITRIEIKDLSPPADINQAMARQMKAERDKRAEILIAEGEKQSAVLRAEGEKEAAIREAEGRREAAFLDAEAREREASAEAEATRMVSHAIAEGDVNAINYFLGQKYIEAFEKLAVSKQQKTVIVPAELSSLAATIGGVAELAKLAGKDTGVGRSAEGSGAVPPTR